MTNNPQCISREGCKNERLCQEAGYCIRPEAKTSKQQFGWLIEMRGRDGLYFSPGYRSGDKWQWVTENHDEAVRFSRKEDANRVISAFRTINTTFFQGPEWVAVEHGWHERPAAETTAVRDTGIDDVCGARLFEGDRVRVEWTAELGITEIHCIAEGIVQYMPDKITAAWFVKFDQPYRCGVCEDGVYETDSQMLVQVKEIGDECLIYFKKLGTVKTNGDPT